ncbi:ligase-associated DNA damage response endonuclease PdeM [Parapedobacter sp. ISTM3]|uniref:Putative phosphoesterase n=1 Tax=Parapedobacter luteus TaxID=623280 RepID=A0A1T5AYH4_9SPHI|nr:MULTISPECIES: ligase-associated DNA damage response endonuclease PdeM [Parapedobacter]MBK1440371.1 ligase-associated DNA damage response endonuclease PdeM [Parapedobacter sp. ISTM3]SKB40035.1 putative phosphoesterase [Parapedobacter luteus]
MSKTIDIMGTPFALLPERALLLPAQKTLVVADWHLGKAAHFRKAGIFMPSVLHDKDTTRLQSLLDGYPIRTVVFLGDLFHSDLNSEWLAFEQFRSANTTVRFVLTRGNHDILPDNLLKKNAIEVFVSYPVAPHIVCTHHPMEHVAAGLINIAGHVHPGCLIPTKGRQTYRLPCFYHYRQTLILPAFGALTGVHLLQPLRDANIYPIAGNEVWKWIPTER